MTEIKKTHTAILFATHEFSNSVLEAFRKLCVEARGYGDVFILHDGRNLPPATLEAPVFTFDFAALKREFPQALGDTYIPGNCHLAFWDFFRHHPTYQFVWIIEYDVRISGSWGVVFEHYRGNDSDLICCHLRSWEQEPDWCWWRSLRFNGRPLPVEARLRAFLPIQRLSAQAMQAIHNALVRNCEGHFEAFIPSFLRESGLRLEDMGGDGPFVPKGRRNSFYTSLSTSDGSLFGLGTMRFRPPHAFWGFRKNRLYHPVKAGSTGLLMLLANIRTICRQYRKAFARKRKPA